MISFYFFSFFFWHVCCLRSEAKFPGTWAPAKSTGRRWGHLKWRCITNIDVTRCLFIFFRALSLMLSFFFLYPLRCLLLSPWPWTLPLAPWRPGWARSWTCPSGFSACWWGRRRRSRSCWATAPTLTFRWRTRTTASSKCWTVSLRETYCNAAKSHSRIFVQNKCSKIWSTWDHQLEDAPSWVSMDHSAQD